MQDAHRRADPHRHRYRGRCLAAELKHGSKWVARGIEVSAAGVSRAAKEPREDLFVSIYEVTNEAKEQQQAKLAALEAELERAKQALADLQDWARSANRTPGTQRVPGVAVSPAKLYWAQRQ